MSLHNIYKSLCDGLALAPVQGSYVQALGNYFSVVDTPGINYDDEVLVQALINSGGPGTAEVVIEDTFDDFPATGANDAVYVTRDDSTIWRYDSTLNNYVLLNNADTVVNTEETTTFFARLSTRSALNAATYNNGTSGVTATITGDVNGIVAQASTAGLIDGLAAVAGDTLLIKDQVAELQNGLYEVTTLGDPSNPFVLTRLGDYDTTADADKSIVFIQSGVLNVNGYFSQNTASPTIGTDPLVYNKSASPSRVNPIIFAHTYTETDMSATSVHLDGTTYPTSVPGYGATLTANSVGAMGTIGGITVVTNTKILINAVTNTEYNGVWRTTHPGSATQKWQLQRVIYNGNAFSQEREYHIVRTGASEYGGIYSIISNTLQNADWGTGTIVFDKLNTLSNILTTTSGGNAMDDLQTITSVDGLSEWMMNSSNETWLYRAQNGSGLARVGLYTDDHFFGMVDSSDPSLNGLSFVSSGFANLRLGSPTNLPGPGDLQFENNDGDTIIYSTEATSKIELNSVSGIINLVGLPTHASEAAASGLTTDSIYKTVTGEVRIKL